MITAFLLKGLLIDFSIAMAIGPIAILCISRTIERGKLFGLAIGLGAATTDGIYGLIAGFGLTFITSFLAEHEFWIHLVGGMFLFYLGIKIFLTKPTSKKTDIKESGLIKSYLITVFLTLTSPMTILFFMTIFAGLGIGTESTNDYASSSLLVLGVFIGSAMFYFFLSSLVAIFRTRMTIKHLAFGNKLSGIIIGVFGVTLIFGTLSTSNNLFILPHSLVQ